MRSRDLADHCQLLMASPPELRVPWSRMVRTQHQFYRFEVRLWAYEEGSDEDDTVLSPPLLFSALVHNCRARFLTLHALGNRWLLPPHSAFTLLPMARWGELRQVRPAGGYKLVLADPPWHSASVRRASLYETCDKAKLLAELAPAIRMLVDPSSALLACWITNSRHVQHFVEEVLFPQCGARPIARWYWLKLLSDGRWAPPNATPWSPHRKPWEVVCIGYIGAAPPPPSVVPTRLAIASIPADAHSAKPPLDVLFQRVARHLRGRPAEAAAADPVGAAAAADDEVAWRTLPKIELFAREIRPCWHAAGDEVLLHQHEGLFADTDAVVGSGGDCATA